MKPKTPSGRAPGTPNLQNIPVRTKEGRRIRDAFRSPKDLANVDYTQIELQIHQLKDNPHELQDD